MAAAPRALPAQRRPPSVATQLATTASRGGWILRQYWAGRACFQCGKFTGCRHREIDVALAVIESFSTRAAVPERGES